MKSNQKWTSRLTFFLVVAFLLLISLLTYLSVTSISNLKELTEKTINEEKNNIYQNILNEIQNELENVSDEYSRIMLQQAAVRDSFDQMQQQFPFMIFPFQYKGNGNFNFPKYESSLPVAFQASSISEYSDYFLRGEYAEYQTQNLSEAYRNYLKCLGVSVTRYDSVKSINALGRISHKLGKVIKAGDHYGTIITSLSNVRDENGFPYSYYAVKQLLNISQKLEADTVLSYTHSWIQSLYIGELCLNSSTSKILNQIDDFLINNTFTSKEKLQVTKDQVKCLDTRISLIDQFLAEIDGYWKLNSPGNNDMGINGFAALKHYSDTVDYILFVKDMAQGLTGYAINLDKFMDILQVSHTGISFNFQYSLEFVKINDPTSGKNINQHLQLNPYIPQYAVQIELTDKSVLKDYINTRRWIYGTILTLILIGFLLIIVIILRDIRREKQLVMLKSDFVSNVSHELKSPITSIFMFAESILLNRINEFTRQKVYLEMILKESTRLKGMINNILEYSHRNENPGFKYSIKQGDLSSLLNGILIEMKYWFEVNKISLSKQIAKEVMVEMDSEKIRQVLENLISNAIKFTPESGEIKIRLNSENSQHTLEIEDTGYGIPEYQINKIFDRFYRVSGTETEGISGTGLGLTVVKEIIEAHNWKINVKSQEGKGSIFSIII